MIALIIYLISIIDSFRTVLWVGFGGALVCFIIGAIWFLAEIDSGSEGEELLPMRKLRNKSLVAMIVLVVTVVLIPTSKVMVAMYLVPKLAKNEQIKLIPKKALEIMNLKLDEWSDELREKTKEKE